MTSISCNRSSGCKIKTVCTTFCMRRATFVMPFRYFLIKYIRKSPKLAHNKQQLINYQVENW